MDNGDSVVKMEEILIVVTKLLENKGDETILKNQFYKKFCEFKIDNKNEKNYLLEFILPKMYTLYDRKVIRKDVIYLTLIAYGNLEELQECVKYEKTAFTLNIEDPSSLYDFCIFKKRHWFPKIITNHESHKHIFRKDICNKILTVKLIQLVNLSEMQIQQVKILLEEINPEDLDDFWRHYVKEIKHLVSVLDFCKNVMPNIDIDDIFSYTSDNCVLETFSKYLDIEHIDWNTILCRIYEEEDMHQSWSNTQSQNFIAFSIIGNIFKLITPGEHETQLNINCIAEDITMKLLNLENKTLQITLLENIFVTMFTKTKHVCNENGEEYICKEKHIRLILYLLRQVLDKIKMKNIYDKNSDEYTRFIRLNKYVTDATWRMELISTVKNPKKYETHILRYMLAPPESLIQMCLKQGDFKRVYEVIKIFSLKKMTLSSEIEYTEKLRTLRDKLTKTFKMKAIHETNPDISVSNVDLAIDKIIEYFFKNNPVKINDETENLVLKLSCEHNFFSHFKTDHEIFMNMLDLAMTEPKRFEDCEVMLQLAFDSNTLDNDITSTYGKFCKTLLESCKEIGYNKSLTASEILLSPRYLNISRYKKEEEFYKRLAELYEELNNGLKINEKGILNSNHPTHKSILKLNTLCTEYVVWSQNQTDNVKYISKLYNYLKAFSKILYIEQNSSDIISKGKNASYFDMLYHNRSELMGKLLFERHLDPSEFEKYFGKLKLDYLYHVIGNCFPTINLHTQENVTKEELYPENSLYIPSKSIIAYIQKRNWLLAFILNEMYKVDGVLIDISEVRVQAFLNYMKLPKIQHLKALFNNNKIVTTLQNDISSQKVSEYVNKQILKSECMLSSYYSQTSNDSFETGEEILEDAITSTNWKELHDIINSISENQLKKTREFLELKDTILVNLVQDGFEIDYFKYAQFISDRDLRVTTILDNMKKWPGEFCIDIIKSETTKFNGKQDAKFDELMMWLQRIELYEELKHVLDIQSNWWQVFRICNTKPENVISKLLFYNKINLLLEFMHLHKPNEDLLLKVNANYLVRVFNTSIPHEQIKILLDNLPYRHSINICYNLLKLLKNLDSLQFVVDYLLNNVKDDLLKNVEVSLKMLSAFPQNEQEQLLRLIYDPIHIIETLVMNTKLEKLSTVLNILKSEISYTEVSEDQLCVEKIDEVLRNYAEKSLDFRVITQPNPRLLRTPEHKLMQSIDSLYLDADSREFIMPEEVPTKDEWVPNDEVLECMCCQQVVFSMFNRRHHCRRCGRIVCYSCSLHRMLVPSYEDILVRVCIDCYHQTMGESNTSELNDTISTKSVMYDYWLLTDDPEHNKIVREEFSYEHAPSVSLCLSIMKYHSKSIEYPKFLLDQCNVMLKLLQPSQEPIQEIDYLLVIKMLKSLAIAAKMSSIECTLHYGTSLVDRILSQADLLGLLAERGCLNLLPISGNTNQGPYIDGLVLRKLRDRLLEREQWNLALEVSTKAGLDNTGVFAAWGKSCLKAGSLVLAREKFQRCLDKTGHYESTSDQASLSDFDESHESLNRGRYISRTSNMSSVSDTKPVKNPPILNEIIYILESKTLPVDSDVIKDIEDQQLSNSTLTLNQSFGKSSQAGAAISILSKLKNLKNISNGNYCQSIERYKLKSYSSRPSIDYLFYDECIYYLTKYGTHSSLLDFYVKHGDISRALNYIVDNQLNTDLFIDVYMKCLKDGVINILQENMAKIDSTLEVWKDYLRHICRHLEKHCMLHSLYQLQQFMGDYIRAAMTCIRFYQENVTNFSDLSANVSFLQKAEEHLKYVLEQEQWVDVATVRKMSSTSKESFEEKAITNPSLVMKVSPKDIDKHINTIWRQKELVSFLAECENLEMKPLEFLTRLLQLDDKESVESSTRSKETKLKIPTLFGSTQEKLHLVVLAIVCGENVEDGFEIALRIIQEFKLKPAKVYCEAGKQLAKAERYNGIGQLVSCIKHSGTSDNTVTDMCDEMLTLAVATFTKANVSGTKVEDLIKLISDRATKISAYIEAKQLKTAYFLAVKYKRMSDIRRILREAEMLNQPNIKALCQKVLLSHSHTPAHSNDS